MDRRTFLAACAALITLAMAGRAGESAQTEIQSLIKQLGSKAFREREEATKTLDKMGGAAIAALRKAARQNRDAEVRRRAGLLLASFERRRLRELNTIEGNWKVVSVEMDGKKDPDGELFDALRNMTIGFTKDKQVVRFAGGEKTYMYKLDLKHKPQVIRMEGDVSTAGAYALKGDTLKICLPNFGKGGGVLPDALATTKGDGRLLLVLMRQAN